jgi:hypothetical protein
MGRMVTREEVLATPPPVTHRGTAMFEEEEQVFYGRVLDALDTHGVRYMVGGAIALNAYTEVWRWTRDLDLFIPETTLEAAHAACEAEGLHWLVVYQSWLSKALDGHRYVDFIHRAANGLYPVDESWHERSSVHEIMGREVPIIPAEELLLSKAFVCNRNRFDGADVCHLIYHAHDRIRWDVLAENAEQHANLLLAFVHLYRWAYPAFADAIPESFVETLHRNAAKPVLAPPFRGRLMDLPSFEVDVEGFGLPDPHELLPQG